MKSILVVAFAFVLSGSLVNAQTWYLATGLTLSRTTLASNTPLAYGMQMKNEPGFTFGVMAGLPLGNRVNFQTGAAFIQKGQHTYQHSSENGVDFAAVEKLHLNYLEIPIHLKMIIMERSSWNIYIKAGLNAACLLGGSDRTRWNSRIDNTSISGVILTNQESISPTVVYGTGKQSTSAYYYIDKRFDIGFYCGLGAVIGKSVNIDIGFTQGMVPISYGDVKGLNQVFQILISTPIRPKSLK